MPGLNGSGSSVFVPTGHVYVVKQLAAYASSSGSQVNVFFQDDTSGAALWRHNVPAVNAGWGGYYGAFVFGEGDGFHFQVDADPFDHADVFCSGYDLTGP